MSIHHSLENHWLGLMASVAGGGRVTRTAGAVVLTNPTVAGMSFNFMALRDPTPDTLAATLEAGSALLAAEGRPACAWRAPAGPGKAGAPAPDPPGDTLVRLGWRRAITQSVLTAALPHPMASAHPAPDSVSVSEVRPGRALTTWARVLTDAYEPDPVTARHLRTAWTSLAAAPDPSARYHLARLGSRAVGTGLTWLRSGVAGLYCGAVLPAFRHRGVERATLLRRLAEAAAAGATLAYTQTEAGSPVEHLCAQRLGFEVAYQRELWLPPGM